MNRIELVKEKLIQMDQDTILIAIDGRCASGKSTFAKELAEALDADLFHLDDFFLRPEQRTIERYETPGMNADHERFLEEVILPWKAQKEFVWYPFDCTVMKVKEEGVRVVPKKTAVVEGSYCMCPIEDPYYDLRICMDISPEEQQERILKRNGPEKLKVFNAKWIPLEELYFQAYPLEKRCDLVFDTSGEDL